MDSRVLYKEQRFNKFALIFASLWTGCLHGEVQKLKHCPLACFFTTLFSFLHCLDESVIITDKTV